MHIGNFKIKIIYEKLFFHGTKLQQVFIILFSVVTRIGNKIDSTDLKNILKRLTKGNETL